MLLCSYILLRSFLHICLLLQLCRQLCPCLARAIFYQLGIYIKNRDCKNWYKTAEIMSIAIINVKVQSSVCFLEFYTKIRVFFTRTPLAAVLSFKNANLHVKLQQTNIYLDFYMNFRDLRLLVLFIFSQRYQNGLGT